MPFKWSRRTGSERSCTPTSGAGDTNGTRPVATRESSVKAAMTRLQQLRHLHMPILPPESRYQVKLTEPIDELVRAWTKVMLAGTTISERELEDAAETLRDHMRGVSYLTKYRPQRTVENFEEVAVTCRTLANAVEKFGTQLAQMHEEAAGTQSERSQEDERAQETLLEAVRRLADFYRESTLICETAVRDITLEKGTPVAKVWDGLTHAFRNLLRGSTSEVD